MSFSGCHIPKTVLDTKFPKTHFSFNKIPFLNAKYFTCAVFTSIFIFFLCISQLLNFIKLC